MKPLVFKFPWWKSAPEIISPRCGCVSFALSGWAAGAKRVCDDKREADHVKINPQRNQNLICLSARLLGWRAKLKSWAETRRRRKSRPALTLHTEREPFICFMWFSLPSVDTSHKQAVKMKCLQARRARAACREYSVEYIYTRSRRRVPLLFSLCSLCESEKEKRESPQRWRGTHGARVSSSLARFYPYRFFFHLHTIAVIAGTSTTWFHRNHPRKERTDLRNEYEKDKTSDDLEICSKNWSMWQ